MKTYFVTSAANGLGLGLVKRLSERRDVIVYAGTKDVTNEKLRELSHSHKNVHVLKITPGDVDDARAAAFYIDKVNIFHVSSTSHLLNIKIRL